MFYKETNFQKTSIGNIPRDWAALEIEEVAEINKESRDPAQKPHASFLYIDIESIENGTGVISEPKKMLGRDAPSRARRVVHENDVIMSTVRPYLKAFTLIPRGLDNEICSTGFAVFTCKPSIIPKYLLSCLFSNTVINQCSKMMVGAQYPALNESQVSKIKIPVAYIGEQQKLAEVFSSVDAALNETREIIAKTERLKQGLMQELFTKGIGHKEFKKTDIGKIPKAWRFGKIADFSKTGDDAVQTGPFGLQLHASDYVQEGVPLILIKNVVDGRILENNMPHISETKAKELGRYRLKAGDIVFSRVGSVGRGAVIKQNQEGWLISGQMLRVRLENPEINNDFLGYTIVTNWFKKALESRTVGATRKSINTEILSNLPLVVPPLNEQHKIAEMLSNIDEKLEVEIAEKERLERIKQGLMDVLLTGKIRLKM